MLLTEVTDELVERTAAALWTIRYNDGIRHLPWDRTREHARVRQRREARELLLGVLRVPDA